MNRIKIINKDSKGNSKKGFSSVSLLHKDMKSFNKFSGDHSLIKNVKSEKKFILMKPEEV